MQEIPKENTDCTRDEFVIKVYKRVKTIHWIRVGTYKYIRSFNSLKDNIDYALND